jgi:hypothetical protein
MYYKKSRNTSLDALNSLRLKHPGIVFRFPAGVRDISFLLSTQIGSGAHSASNSMGIGGAFLGVKAAGASRRPPPSNGEVKNEWSYVFVPHFSSWHAQGLYLLHCKKLNQVGDEGSNEGKAKLTTVAARKF